MKTINVIQARMGSTRLPGKSMMELLPGLTLIEMVIRRVMNSKLAEKTVLATSVNSDCDPLCEIAERCECDVVRGSETDVLSRFVTVVGEYKPDAIVRICADNPFVSPVEIDKLIQFFNKNNFDYAYNNDPDLCGLPDGLGAEIVESKILREIYLSASLLQKEHVTQYILDNVHHFKVGMLKADRQLNYPEIKLDIDTPEELEQRKILCGKLGKGIAPYWTSEEIIELSSIKN